MPPKTLGSMQMPFWAPIARGDGRLSAPWWDYFNLLPLTLSLSIERVNSVTLETQGAAITATDFSGGGLTVGLYRVSYYARITRAATTSSSLTVTVAFTGGGVSPSFSGAAMTGNTTTTVGSSTWLIRIDNATTAINYSTAYVSVGATSMQYCLDLVLEKVKV